jgi:hypothetical protein
LHGSWLAVEEALKPCFAHKDAFAGKPVAARKPERPATPGVLEATCNCTESATAERFRYIAL